MADPAVQKAVLKLLLSLPTPVMLPLVSWVTAAAPTLVIWFRPLGVELRLAFVWPVQA